MHTYLMLTPAAVREAAHLLMRTHGATTTLEVKNMLRNQGFWALQREISVLMAGLAQHEGWQFHDTGRFRIYVPGGGFAPFSDPAHGWSGLC